ncbi:MAG: Dot/Icm T4SS effector Zinc-dependent metalloprotease LegP [Legionella sp.]|jgi:hypothetical protein
MKKCTLLFTSLFIAQLHAAQLGTAHIADPVLGNKTLTYEKINQYAVVEGDIILASMNEINKQGAVITRKISGTRWPHGVIPYVLDEELPFANKLAILQAMDHWQQHSNLEFVELNSKNHDKYQDYIYFIPAEGTTCSSFVGRQGGEQIINLAPRCTTMNTVHEIGHALGMWHEQSRADRNSYVRIVWENIEEEYKYNFLQQLSDGKDFGEYDYQSIMHYGPYSFSKNGLATIIPLQQGIEIGQRNQLSDKDIAAIKAMYPEL